MFRQPFLKKQSSSQTGTRNSTNYVSHHICRTNIKKFTVLYNGPKIWNSLPIDIVNAISKATFKNKLINHLISK